MTDFTTGMGAGAYLQFSMQEVGVSATGNYSTVNFQAYLVCGNGQSWNADPTGFSTSWNSGSYTYDFRSGSVAVITSGSVNIGHNSNGTGSVYGQVYTNNTGSSIGGPATAGGTIGLSNIAPQPVQNLSTSGITSSSVTVTFGGPTSGSSPSNYVVQQATDSAFTQNLQQHNNTSGSDQWTGLNPNQTYYYRVLSQNASGNSSWSTTSATTLIAPPAAPTGLTASNVLPTGFTVSWTTPTNVGGQAPTGYDVQYALTSDFASPSTVSATTYGTSQTLTGLAPGNTYYVRVRVNNSAGAGTWSTTLTQTTLPSVAPGLTVTAQPSGKSAVAVFSPPSGVTGVSQYLLKVVDQTTSVETDYSSVTTTYTVIGLLPGRSYSYSAAFVIGGYTSPYSTPIVVQQPAPSTNPGSFFDGNTAATADQTYSFTGTANESTSLAKGKGVKAWVVSALSGGSVVFARVTGAFAGTYSGQMTVTGDLGTTGPTWVIHSDASNAGYLSPVQGGSPYDFSIYLNPSKDIRAAVIANWYDASLHLISQSVDGGHVILGAADWVRIDSVFTAPANAVYAGIEIDDQPGTGWAQLLCGDYIAFDAHMTMLNSIVDYFDGDTANTPYAQHDWLGASNASTSSMTPLTPATVDPLADPDIPPIPPAPAPPQIEDEGIIAVGTWRRYWANLPVEDISSYLTEVPTIYLTTSGEAERQVRIRVYENPDNLAPGDVDTTSWISEQIVSYMPANTVMMIDGVQQRCWAQVNGGSSVSADHLLYGTGGIPATWPVLSCGIAYLMSFDTPLDATASNLTVDVSLTRRM